MTEAFNQAVPRLSAAFADQDALKKRNRSDEEHRRPGASLSVHFRLPPTSAIGVKQTFPNNDLVSTRPRRPDIDGHRPGDEQHDAVADLDIFEAGNARSDRRPRLTPKFLTPGYDLRR